MRTAALHWGIMLRTSSPASMVEAPEAPAVVEPIEPALKAELLTDIEERGQVTVQCHFAGPDFNLVRIWQSTYLICRRTGHRSELLHAEGISVAPLWTPVLPGEAFSFTLVFAPLPGDCAVFDLVEVIAQPGGFHVPGIGRNERDLYKVTV